MTHGALALAGDLARSYTNYQGEWQVGLRVDGLRDALAYEYVQQGDDDVVRPYGQDLYERTTLCGTDELIDHPAAVTERLVVPLLRGLAIDHRYPRR